MRMKIDENSVQTIGAGPMTNSKMGIRDSDMHVIINILRSKMYSNPIRTIIQEVSSNARDAHRERDRNEGGDVWGKRPIKIKLPDRHDNSFYIQDFGVGVDPDRMENVFINYGASTKRGDNLETGGFGLGAKSPFSYTDQFGIVSVTPDESGNLILRQYAAIIDGHDGFVRLIEERPANSNEERGTKIVIPVKAQDFNDFRKWTIETCKYWGVRPVVVSKTDAVDWPKYDIDHEGKDKNWLIYKKSGGNSWGYSQNNEFNRPKAIVDGIPYPLDKASIEDSNDASLNSDINNLWGYPVLLKFSTGEVNLTANREELDYSDTDTPKMIRDRFKTIIGELQEKFGKDIKGCKNLMEANAKWNDIRSGYSSVVSSVKWNGITVTGHVFGTDNLADVSVFRRDASNNDGLGRSSGSAIDFHTKDMLIAYDYSDSAMASRSKVGHLFDTHPNLKTVFAVKFNSPSDIYDNHDIFKNKPSLKKKGTSKDLYDWWAKKYDVDKMAPINLDNSPRRRRKTCVSGGAGTGTPVVAIKEYNENSYNSRTRWTNCNEDLEDGNGTIVWLKSYTAYADSSFLKPISEYDLDAISKEIGIKLHSVMKRYADKVGDSWSTVEDALVKKYDEFKVKYDAITGIDCKKPLSQCNIISEAAVKTAFKKCKDKSEARTLFYKWDGMDSQAAEKKNLANKCNRIREILIKLDDKKYSKKYDELKLDDGNASVDYLTIFTKRYSMIFALPHWQIRQINTEGLTEYIEAMDVYLGDKYL